MKISRKRSLDKVSSLLEKYDYVLYEYDETDSIFKEELNNFFSHPINHTYLVFFLFAGRINRISFKKEPNHDGENWAII